MKEETKQTVDAYISYQNTKLSILKATFNLLIKKRDEMTAFEETLTDTERIQISEYEPAKALQAKANEFFNLILKNS